MDVLGGVNTWELWGTLGLSSILYFIHSIEVIQVLMAVKFGLNPIRCIFVPCLDPYIVLVMFIKQDGKPCIILDVDIGPEHTNYGQGILDRKSVV